MLSKTLRLNFCYLKIIHIVHPRGTEAGFTKKALLIKKTCEIAESNQCEFNNTKILGASFSTYVSVISC